MMRGCEVILLLGNGESKLYLGLILSAGGRKLQFSGEGGVEIVRGRGRQERQ